MCDSNDSAGPVDRTTPASAASTVEAPVSLTLLSLEGTLKDLNQHPDKIESCFVELSAEQQVVDMWYLLTPSPEHAQALSKYYQVVVRYRKVGFPLSSKLFIWLTSTLSVVASPPTTSTEQ